MGYGFPNPDQDLADLLHKMRNEIRTVGSIPEEIDGMATELILETAVDRLSMYARQNKPQLRQL